MMKNLNCLFCTKTQYSFIRNYRGVGEDGNEGGLSKRNSKKVVKKS